MSTPTAMGATYFSDANTVPICATCICKYGHASIELLEAWLLVLRTVTPLPTCTSGMAATYPTGRGDSAKATSCCSASVSTSLLLAYRRT